MQKYNFTLAYSHENEEVAQEIQQYLSKADIYLKMISDKGSEQEGIGPKLLKEDDHVLLLISTNFLKSIGTMNNILKSVEPLAKKKILHPVIINGREKMPDGSYISVQTNFDRVSHVIHYMNHWQDKYLDARKEKREAPANMDNEIDKKLLNIRNISAQIGEFLKLIKTQEYISYPMFSQNNFEAFFNRFDIKENHSKIAGLSLGTGALVGGIVANAKNGSGSDINAPIIDTPEVVQPRIIEVPEAPPISETPKIIEEVGPKIIEEVPPEVIEEVKPELIQEEIPDVVERNNTTPPIIEIPKEEAPVIETPIDEIEIEDVSPISVSDQNEVVPLKIENLEGLDEIGDAPIEFPDIPVKSDQEVLNKLIHIKNGDEIGPGFGTNVSDENSVENLSVIQRIIKKREEENKKTVLNKGDDITINGKIGDEVVEMPVNRDQPPSDSKFKPYEKSASDVEQTLHEASNLIEAGKIEKGLAILEEVLYQDPNNVDIRLQYATVLADNLNKKDDAVHHLQKILSVDPHHGNTYVKLGEISESKNNLVIARKYYEKAAVLKPNQPWIFYKLGIMISTHFVGENKIAADYFKQSLNLDKNNVDGHYRYAVILAEDLSNFEKAHKHFKKVIKLKPDHKRVHLDMAKLHRKNGNVAKAEKHYLKAISNYPLIKNENNDALFIQEVKPAPIVTAPPVIEKPVEVVKQTEQVFRVPQNEIKRVLITGATSGIGKATAELFAKHGHQLILTGRRQDRLDILKLHFEQKYKADVHILPFDVTNVNEVRTSFSQLSSEWRNIDILINNAGLAKGYDAIHEGELSDWDAMIDTNIKGLLYMTRAFSPIMVEKQSGHIINVCSTAGTEVYPKGNVYCATKFAVDALTKAIRLDLHKYNVRVSQISPGHVEETEFAKVRFGDAERAKIYEDFQPLKSEDVAESIYFIATRPDHVNIQDILLMGTQQANNNYIDRSGRK